ncbi:MAG: OsmC family protein [Polyangiaceae bacterium]
MDIKVTFPGGKRVDAQVGEFHVQTDQPRDLGGEAQFIAPFEMFLASLATCSGIFALGFCQARGLSTEGLALTQKHEYDSTGKKLAKVTFELTLPAGFPETHRAAIVRAIENCKVKKVIHNAPEFEVAVMNPPEVQPAAQA